MTIISVSLNDKILKELDRVQKEIAFTGRSEVIRAGIRMLISDAKERESLTGRIKGVLLLIHAHDAENFITKIKHKFLDIIHTQLHNRFREGKCLEMFILDGDANRIRELTNLFQKNEGIEYSKFLLT